MLNMYLKKSQTDCIENSPFFQQNKNFSKERKFTRNQTHYSEDEKYLNRNQQQQKNNQRKYQGNDVDQPDIFHPNIFEPYMKSQRQSQPQYPTRQNFVPRTHNTT